DVRSGVADREPHHEPVELCLRKRIGALVLDRVLRRDDHERLPELVGGRVDRDLALLHRLEEGGLRLRARPVDLVPEDDVCEDRARLELEVAPLLVEDVDARDVGGKQVRSELDPSERAVDRPGDRLGEHRLADARDVLDQEVAFRDQGDQSQANLTLLALDDLLDVRLDLVESLGESLPLACVSFPSLHIPTSTPDPTILPRSTGKQAFRFPSGSCPWRPHVTEEPVAAPRPGGASGPTVEASSGSVPPRGLSHGFTVGRRAKEGDGDRNPSGWTPRAAPLFATFRRPDARRRPPPP